MKLNKYLFNTVNNMELGHGQRSVVLAQARSALLASAPCAQYSVFRGGHSLRLAFGSFFYCRILAVFWLFVQTVYFSFFVVFGYAWFFVQSLFLRTLG